MKKLGIAAHFFRVNGFGVRVFKEAQEVAPAFREYLGEAQSVGFGGSGTLRQLGLDAIVREAGLEFFDHWEEGLDEEAEWRRRLAQGRADVFATSANAATSDGRLVLIDGIGNRVAASVFGPKRVLFVVGKNKVVHKLDDAIGRARNVAAPRRSAELGLQAPCVKDGRCHDCKSTRRICRSLLIIERPSFGMQVDVWLVHQDLGL